MVKNFYKPKGVYGKNYEAQVIKALDEAGHPYTFEGLRLPYTVVSTYYPDIVLPNGIIVEIKTYLGPEDEEKMKAVKRCHPDLDIRFVFEKPNKKMPRRQMTHGEWALKYGFLYAGGTIPEEWTQ